MNDLDHSLQEDYYPLTVLARCETPNEAHVLRAFLESLDIPALVFDEHSFYANSLLAPAMGWIRVMVPSSHLDAAQDALGEYRKGNYALTPDPGETATDGEMT